MGKSSKHKRLVALVLIIIAISLIGIIVARFVVEENITTNAAKYEVSKTSTTEDGRFKYSELYDGTIEITKYVGTDTVVAIPSTVDGKSVTSIGSYAFFRCSSLTEITIPEGVTAIKDSTFSGCSSLTQIIIPDSVTSIGMQAFFMCTNLTSLVIPNSVTNIDYEAFGKCKSLTEITIPDSVTSMKSNGFYGCSSLTDIKVDNNNNKYCDDNGILYTKDKTEIIVYPAGKTGEKYEIPEGVTIIDSTAFFGCKNLMSIEIPSTVTRILQNKIVCDVSEGRTYWEDNMVFNGCTNLTDINVDSNNQNYASENGILFNKERTKIIKYPEGKEQTEYRVPEEVTSINSCAFSACTNLTSIEISNGVTMIGYSIFSGCTNLTNISIPEGVTVIGMEAFMNCTNLTNISIPEGVTSIGTSAFKDCTSLTQITIPDSVTSIGYSAFSRCSSLTEIIIPKGVTSIKRRIFEDCESLTKITIPDSVTSIDEKWNPFSGCNDLRILCFEGSVAETHAKKYKIPYEIIYFRLTDIDIDEDGLIIKGINPKTTIEEIRTFIETNLSYEIINQEENVVEDNTTIVGTGYKIKLSTGTRYKIVVTGDANGDGDADFKDLTKINSHRLNKKLLEGEYLLAADVNEDGVADFKDLVKINKFRLHKITEL